MALDERGEGRGERGEERVAGVESRVGLESINFFARHK